jgi:hypothetical protein
MAYSLALGHRFPLVFFYVSKADVFHDFFLPFMVNRLFAPYSRLAEPKFDNELAGVLPDEKILSEMGNYNDEMVKADVLLSAEGLHASSRGVRVKFSGGKRTAIRETKELIAGFWLIQVKSKEEAILPQSVAAAISFSRPASPRPYRAWPLGAWRRTR